MRKREAERLVREAARLVREREVERLARKRVAREYRGLGASQCIVTAGVSTVCHAPLAWNSGPIPAFTTHNVTLREGLFRISPM